MAYFVPVFKTDDDIALLYRQAQEIAFKYNKAHEEKVSAAKLNFAAVLHLIYQTIINEYLKTSESNPFSRLAVLAEKNEACQTVLDFFDTKFPTEIKLDETLGEKTEETIRAFFLHVVYHANPALIKATASMLYQEGLVFPEGTKALKSMLGGFIEETKLTEDTQKDLFSFLTYPARQFPDSLIDQIDYILSHWNIYLPENLKILLLKSRDYIVEEEKPRSPSLGGPGPLNVPNYSGEPDIESFSEDRSWMPNVVMMAKSTLVWLDQLSSKYQRDIHTLDAIPDEELDSLRDNGFTALWLIGLWERSPASKRIKNLCGNSDAESSAYSLKGYNISDRLGGWNALNNLKDRCWKRGIRLASDMVPNHTGLDSDWLFTHPEYFIQQDYPPFPSYSYTGTNLSNNPDFEIKIEDHYYDRSDAAVTFMKRDNRTGETKFIFHGNDGTTMAWNDTAQIDFLNPQAREAVIQQILDVARAFPIIRFDAAMTLAKRHIQRLWYPKPGCGGDVAGRVSHEMSDEEFNRRIPKEFWREVVDRVQAEVPDTLLLAEAFWMMESYFVRTLGMHRVYNSAFMHMMKNEDNKKYRDSIKSTLAFDPEILKRYVNFMNNPDEDTAIAQFGDSDKYFGVCTVLSTMPGLPMFGHGQIEGYREKYGMEFQRAYWNEKPNEYLVNKHRERIFPVLKKRYLFSECKNFQLFDAHNNSGVQESIFAYTNGDDKTMTLVLYNNQYEHAEGTIFTSAPKMTRTDDSRVLKTVTLAQSLRLTMSPRKYVIYKNMTNGLFYIVPSMKIFDEGYHVSLDGYQTVVITDIHEVEDMDGIYDKLYKYLNGRGTADINLEIRLLYLRPFYDTCQVLMEPKFEKELKLFLTGKNTQNAKKEIMMALGTCYTYMDELQSLFTKLDLEYRSMKPSEILDLLNKIETVCSFDLFTNGNIILANTLVKLFTASFIIKPFMHNGTMEELETIVEKLELNYLFEMDVNVIKRSVLLASNNQKDVRELINNQLFLKLIGCNEYQNIRWFAGESFQDCMYLALLSNAIHQTEPIDENEYKITMQHWLRKNAAAEYKVDRLLI